MDDKDIMIGTLQTQLAALRRQYQNYSIDEERNHQAQLERNRFAIENEKFRNRNVELTKEVTRLSGLKLASERDAAAYKSLYDESDRENTALQALLANGSGLEAVLIHMLHKLTELEQITTEILNNV